MPRAITNFTTNWSPGQRLFAFIVLLLFSCCLPLLLGVSGLLTRILILLFCALLLWFGAAVAVPPEPSRDRLRRYSLRVALGVTAPVVTISGARPHWVSAIPLPSTPAIAPEIHQMLLVVVLGLTWGGVVALNWMWRDPTATGQIGTRLAREFPERGFLERLRLVCADFRNDLDRIDADTNWSHAHFVSLEAEVEIVGDTSARRRIADLLPAIRQDRTSRLFLVLGDPGAGKSVALRKLCRDLLDEVERSGRLPVYISLKEWRPSVPWTKERPPDVAQLKAFILGNLRRRVQMSAGFLKAYFDRMVDHGRIFFILDSFDEIPAVLDVDESSWLVRALSEAVTDLLAGGSEARGVLASRHYRRPRLAISGYRLLEIRPFSEQKIAAAIDRATTHAEPVKRAVFVSRPDLGALVRNPFLLGLLLSYIEQHSGELPASMVGLFRSFIAERVEEAAENLQEHGLDSGVVLDNAEAIAHEMFEAGSFGLEMPVAMLGALLPGRQIEITAELLAGMRIGRIGAGTRVFSFVHRRFNEYFLVNRFRTNPGLVPLEAIPSDARLRDAIALYAAIAEPAEAKRIMEYCLSEAAPLMTGTAQTGDITYRRGVQSVRFLVDAFRGREAFLRPYAARFESFIGNRLVRDGDILVAKNAVEAIGLASPEVAPMLVSRALDLQDTWVLETAIRGARYLRGRSERVRAMVLKYFLSIPRWQLLGSQAAAVRILSLSEDLAETAEQIQMYGREFLYVGVLDIACFIIQPIAVLAAIGYLVLLFLLLSFWYYSFSRRDMRQLRNVGGVRIAHHGHGAGSSVPTKLRGLLLKRLDWAWLERFLVRNPFRLSLLILIIVFIIPCIVVLYACSQYWGGKTFPSPLFDTVSRDHYALASITLAVGVLGLPWYSLYQLVRRSLQHRHVIRRAVFGGLKFGAVLVPLLAGFVWIMSTNAVHRIIVWLAPLAPFSLGVVIFIGIARFYIGRRRDRRTVRKWLARFDGRRASVSEALAAIGTPQARELFVAGLAAQSAVGRFRTLLGDPANTWPGGRRPNYGDRASTRLARLDESWLSLDR